LAKFKQSINQNLSPLSYQQKIPKARRSVEAQSRLWYNKKNNNIYEFYHSAGAQMALGF